MTKNEQKPSEAEILLRRALPEQPPPGLEDRLLHRLRQVERERVSKRQTTRRSPLAFLLTFAVIAVFVVEFSLLKPMRVARSPGGTAVAKSAAAALPVQVELPVSPESGAMPDTNTFKSKPAVRLKFVAMRTSAEPLASIEAAAEQPATDADVSAPEAPLPGTPLPAFESVAVPGQPLPKLKTGIPGHALPQFAGVSVPGTPLPTFAEATDIGDRP